MIEASFPADFLWGTATASYQVEGAVHEDGRGESIWDRFSHTPGKTYNGHTGDMACDHYHRYRGDVALMKELGLRSYRFSVAWPRIYPDGGGKPNPLGLGFYARLVDELLDNGVAPMLTLYHWDLPQALQERGGWQNRDTARYFADYAATMFERFADRVKLWITHNEPQVAADAGHRTGEHAPGIQDAKAAIQVSHHLLLSHALAVGTFREFKAGGGQVGITLNLSPAYPEGDSVGDGPAAELLDGVLNRWFLDPVLKGRYPQQVLQLYRERYGAPEMAEGDLDALRAASIDFLGVNYYFRILVRSSEKPGELFTIRRPEYQGVQFTDMGWEVYPQGLYELLVRLDRDYGHPSLYVTENGAAYADERMKDNQVQDDDRISYLRDHFLAAHRAMQAGVDLKGYQVWSLMDNFEWSHGYSKRFGIVRVDSATQKRFPKKSAYWYRGVIGHGGA
jgi:beta-glucosidase